MFWKFENIYEKIKNMSLQDVKLRQKVMISTTVKHFFQSYTKFSTALVQKFIEKIFFSESSYGAQEGGVG